MKDDIFKDLGRRMDEAHNYTEKMRAEFLRLKADMPIVVKKGDRAIVACEVLEVSGTSALIEGKETYGDPWQEWIDITLIVGIAKPKQEEDK